MTQEELEIKYLNKWIKINEYEIERKEFDYSSGETTKRFKWEDEPVEGVVKDIDLYEDMDMANNLKYHFLEIKLFIPFQETVTIWTYFEHVTVDIIKTLKRKMQYKRSKKHAGLSK
jgi:hypothetical protein